MGLGLGLGVANPNPNPKPSPNPNPFQLIRSLTSYYCICLESGAISRDSQHYLAKLRSASMGGTDWVLYDNGLNTKDAGNDPLLLRRQLLSVSFERNIMGSGGPSRLQVA